MYNSLVTVKVHFGSYVLQEKYGTLVAVFRLKEEVNAVVIPFASLAQTKLGCPLFVRDQQVVVVPATSIICDISFMHCCGSGCKVQVNTSAQRRVERETIQVDSCTSFTHDCNNEVFYYNVFCLSN